MTTTTACATRTTILRRRRRVRSLAILLTLGLGVVPATARAESGDGSRRTTVTGDWQLGPGVVPAVLYGSPRTVGGRVNGALLGTWTGRWQADLVGTLDPQSGDYVLESRTPSQFTGVYVPDGSHGTLTWVETVRGNVYTGGITARVDVLSGSGDAAFRCSSGHFTYAGLAAGAQVSSGGYTGTWTHGCAGTRAPLRTHGTG